MDKNTPIGSLSVSSAPHIATALDTRKTMLNVMLALVPALAVSTFMFGVRVLILTAVCMAGSVFCEWAYEKIMKKPITVGDLSAALTGMILACNLPANFPFWMAIIGCIVAIVVVKQLFGGIGKNFANPAIVGRIVLLLSFTSQMTTWPVARAYDGSTGATPLAMLEGDQLASLKDMFLGQTGGAMGEVCALALLIGGIYLIVRKIISPIIPVCFIGTVFVIALIYYAICPVAGYSAIYMAMYHVLAGGVILGAFFCATDYVTSPVMSQSKIIFGIACGAITMIIRLMCSYPEGVSFAILFMNVVTPLIDNKVIGKYYDSLYGGGAKKDEK